MSATGDDSRPGAVKADEGPTISFGSRGEDLIYRSEGSS